MRAPKRAAMTVDLLQSVFAIAGGFGLVAIGDSHALLQIDGALHGIDGAPELQQHAIPGGLKYSALVFGDQRVQDVAAPCLKDRHRGGFVNFHQPAKADHIRGHDGGEAAFHCGVPRQL